MVEEIIKARVVFDTGALSGLGKSSTGSSGGSAMGGMSFGKMTAAIFAGNALLKGVSKGIGMLVDASPHLQATLNIFKKSMMLMLRPFGDILSLYLRPFIMKFMGVAMKFYEDYKNGNLWGGMKTAFVDALGILTGEGGLIDSIVGALGGEGLTAGLLLSLIPLGLGALAAALGLGAGAISGGVLLAPLLFAIGGFLFGKGLGLGNFQSGLLAVIGMSAYLLAGTGVAIPVILAMGVSFWAVSKFQKAMKDWAINAGLSNPNFGDGGFTVDALIETIIRPKKDPVEDPQDVAKRLEDIKKRGYVQTPTGGIGVLSDENKKTKELTDNLSILDKLWIKVKKSFDPYGGEGASSKSNIFAGNDINPFEILNFKFSSLFTGSDDLIKEDEKKWTGFHDFLMKMWFEGMSPALVDLPGILATKFKDVLDKQLGLTTDISEKLYGSLQKVGSSITKSLINLKNSVSVTAELINNVQQLNTTVVTTHIIRTIRED